MGTTTQSNVSLGTEEKAYQRQASLGTLPTYKSRGLG
jgi:hypothetical protein